jgi:hypothetical protein
MPVRATITTTLAATLLLVGLAATACGSGTSNPGAGAAPPVATTASQAALSGDSPTVRCANVSVRAQTPSALPSTIGSVAFEGSATDPEIVVVGSGFGSVPGPDPAICPAKAGARYDSRCDAQTLAGNKRDGNDYGATTLGLRWTSSSRNFSAGIYVAGSYLDCIGVVIKSWSPTTVVFGLGCQYALYDPAASGGQYRLQLRGDTRSGTIRYKAAD